MRTSLRALVVILGLLAALQLALPALREVPAPAPSPPVGALRESSALTVDDALAGGIRGLLRHLRTGQPEDLREAGVSLDQSPDAGRLTALLRAYVADRRGDSTARDRVLAQARVEPLIYEYYVRDPELLRKALDAQLIDLCQRRMEVLRQAALRCSQAEGRVPERLEDLAPGYVDAIRPCPATGRPSYPQGWKSRGTAFELRCSGHEAQEIVATERQATEAEGPNLVDDVLAHVQIAQGLFEDHRARLVPVLAKAAGLRPGQTVADVGCGIGYYTLPLARAVSPGGRVLAVDINPSVLDCVRFLASRHPELRIETVLSPSTEPGLPAAQVDAIVLIQVYHMLIDHDSPRDEGAWRERIGPFLRSLRQGLKPGGRLIVEDTRPRRPEDRAHVAPEVVVEQLERAGYRRVSGQAFEQDEFIEVFERG